MRLLPLLIAIAHLLYVGIGAAAETSNVATIDPIFEPGLEILKKATRFSADSAAPSSMEWQPGLQLLVGFKAVEGSKQTIHFVELTTLTPSSATLAGGASRPMLQTNVFGWSGTNRAAKNKSLVLVSSLYPIRVRTFDATGKKLKEGETMLPWQLMTNGLAPMCRISEEISHNTNSSASGKQLVEILNENEEFPRTFEPGFQCLLTMLDRLRSVPAAKEIWNRGQCAFRLPPIGAMAASVVTGRLAITLDVRWDEIARVDASSTRADERCYLLPVDLSVTEGPTLTRVEIVVGNPSGAEVLMGGVRSLRASHPTRPQHEFFAQVLAAGRTAPDVLKAESGLQ